MYRKFTALTLLLLLLLATSAQAEAAQKKYVALGDSITAGVDVAPGHVTPFVDRYESMLEASGDEYRTVNLGVPGWTSSDLLRALQGSRVFRRNVREADEITLYIGTNDMLKAWRRYAFEKPRLCYGERCMRQTVRTFARRYDASLRIISKLRRGDMANVHTATIYRPHVADDKRRGDFRALKPYYRMLNRRLIVLANRHGATVRDVRPAFNGRRNNGDAVKRGMVLPRPDGVHPTDRGMRVIAASLE